MMDAYSYQSCPSMDIIKKEFLIVNNIKISALILPVLILCF